LAVSNIEAGTRALRLYEAWIDQRIGKNLSIKVGLYDLNSEFDSLEAAGLFVGSAHGIGADISQTGLNGPSIFPFTSLAIRVRKSFAAGFSIRAALLDAVPGDPDRPGRTEIRLSSEEGALAIAEFELPLPRGKLLLGHWRYTADFEDFGGSKGRGNAGVYLRGETELVRIGQRRIDGFFRLGTAAGRLNMFDRFASAGVKLTGVFGKNMDDEAGLAVASARTSQLWRDVNGSERSETVVELNYRRGVLPFLTLQPSLQYVVSPSANPAFENAFVVGLRAEVTFCL
jgi:porin